MPHHVTERNVGSPVELTAGLTDRPFDVVTRSSEVRCMSATAKELSRLRWALHCAVGHLANAQANVAALLREVEFLKFQARETQRALLLDDPDELARHNAEYAESHWRR